MTQEEIYKIAPYVEEHYKRCWVEGYIAGLQAKDPTLDDIAEKYAEKMDISKGWFDGCEIDELIKESYKAGAEWAKEQMPMPEDTLIFKKGVEEGKRLMMEEAENGKELLYVCDKSYNIGYRDGKRDAGQKQKGGKK